MSSSVSSAVLPDVPPPMPGTPDPSDHPSPSDGAMLDSGAGGLLEIVVSQRDRFRQRAQQLEEDKGVGHIYT